MVANLVAPADGGPVSRLSDRERGVLELMAQGYSNTEISRQMTIGVGTLEKHIAAVYSKLDLADTGTDDPDAAFLALIHVRKRCF